MSGVFDGFATIALVIGLGILLAHLGVVDAADQRTLSALAFSVASPALLLTVIERGSVSTAVLSSSLLASAGGVAVVVAASVAVSRARRRTAGETVVGALTASYCNAANLGLPIATYVLGDATLVAPVMLMQLVLIQPFALTVLDAETARDRLTVGRVIARPFRNPITIGSLIGLLLAVTHVALPTWLQGSVDLVGDLSVPSMLLAYGVSLRLGPLPGRGVPAMDLAWHVGLKLVAQPLVTYLLARYALQLGHHEVLAATVIAALPTAQNVFVIASRYRCATLLARDVIFISTIASAPVVLVVSLLLT